MHAKLFVPAACAGLLLSRTPLCAHHAFDADFDEKDRITLKGTLTKVEWINPHGWIYLDVKGPDGKVTKWAIETGAPAVLKRRGVSTNDFRVGTEMIVDGFRAKKKAATVAGRVIRLSDGTELFLR